MSTLADMNMRSSSAAAVPQLRAVMEEVPAPDRRPLNVCMIGYTNYDRDGRVMRYAETLARRGDRVDFIALARPGEAPGDELLNGVHLYRIQVRDYKEKSPVSYLSGIMAFLFRTMWFLLWRQRKVRYDLVHVHSVPDFLVFSAWLPKLRGAKVILDIHDLLPELYASKFEVSEKGTLIKLLLVVERKSAAFADYVIAANDLWYEKLVERTSSIDENNCTSIINFPDSAIFRRRGRTRNDGKFIMVFPGSLNWHQGVDIAVRAFARIQDAAPSAEFHIYGDGSAVISLMALAESLGVSDRVRFQGGREIREIARIIENADLGIVPKRANGFGNEAFSTKILEFMMMGLPVVVADTKIDRYYFNDSLVKFFRAGDDAALAEAMLTMIQNPELRSRLAKNALEFSKDFDWETNKNRYLDIVDRLTLPRVTAN